jgi:hypothetical protein
MNKDDGLGQMHTKLPKYYTDRCNRRDFSELRLYFVVVLKYQPHCYTGDSEDFPWDSSKCLTPAINSPCTQAQVLSQNVSDKRMNKQGAPVELQ